MGLTGRRLARLVATAVPAVLVVMAAACGSDTPTGGVDSDDVPRPTQSDTTVASGDGDAQPISADLAFGDADAELAPDEVSLIGDGYVVGDCLVWEAVGSGDTPTAVVPCADEHRFQVTGAAGPPGSTLAAYPDDAEWDALRYRECARQAEAFLGRPLDPHGRLTRPASCARRPRAGRTVPGRRRAESSPATRRRTSTAPCSWGTCGRPPTRATTSPPARACRPTGGSGLHRVPPGRGRRPPRLPRGADATRRGGA